MDAHGHYDIAEQFLVDAETIYKGGGSGARVPNELARAHLLAAQVYGELPGESILPEVGHVNIWDGALPDVIPYEQGYGHQLGSVDASFNDDLD